MNQKLSDWASIAEIVSGIAVVVTLIILVLEIRENTEVLRVSAYADSIDSINDLGALISQDADNGRIWQAYIAEDTDDLDENDLQRLANYVFILFRNYEKAYFFWKSGLIGGEEWERFQRNICGQFGRARSADVDVGTPLTQEFSRYVADSCNE